jgi:hypothetical protein
MREVITEDLMKRVELSLEQFPELSQHVVTLGLNRSNHLHGSAVGDMLQAGVVLVGTQLALTTKHYARINILLVALWLILVAGIHRAQKQL